MLILNELLRTTGFEPLYLLYRRKFFPILKDKKNMNSNIFVLKNIINTQVTTQNGSTGKLYNVSFDLIKEIFNLCLLTFINPLTHFLVR